MSNAKRSMQLEYSFLYQSSSQFDQEALEFPEIKRKLMAIRDHWHHKKRKNE